MSPVFDTRALRKRWFHMPSFAIIAMAGASVAIAYKGVDAWRERWVRQPERTTTELVGRAEIPHIKPDHVTWAVTLTAVGKKEEQALRDVTLLTQRAIDQLAAQGIAREELVANTAAIEASEPSGDALLEMAPPGGYPVTYTGIQIITINSTHIATSLAAYATIVAHPATTLSADPPECWLDDTSALRKQVQQAAWADLQRLVTTTNTQLHHPLGRLLRLNASDADVGAPHDTSCTDGLTATATVGVEYEMR